MYLGHAVEYPSFRETEEKFSLDPDTLTTHCIIVGMTGSGKTGLATILLEEALIQGIPVTVIDPKGDAVNIALRLNSPEDFLKWIEVEEAARLGMSPEEYACKVFEEYSKSLRKYGLTDRKKKLFEESEVIVVTPGSTAGIPLSLLSELTPPENLSWSEHEEVLLNKIKVTVSALLELAGRPSDPLKSYEHVLISSIIEHCWRKNEPLNYSKLLSYIIDPPLDRIGALEVDAFMPENERKKLARDLNRVIASPGFRTWFTGIPLDFNKLFWSPEGKPRAVVFYLAHLGPSEKMFAVTLILEALYSWMFTRPGSSKLKYLLYFDEVYGYLPPYPRNPPSKTPLLMLLKQARAFGLGIILATQNPVDLDYKALTNAGLWIIGKLQTENDKRRVLEGLRLASSGGFNEKELSKIISLLGRRIFLLYDARKNRSILFKTRQAISYLRGPLTLNEISKLKSKPVLETRKLSLKPIKTTLVHTFPEDLEVYYLPPKFPAGDFKPVYYPALYIEAKIEVVRKRPPLDYSKTIRYLCEANENPVLERGEAYGLTLSELKKEDLKTSKDLKFSFANLPPKFFKKTFIKSLQQLVKNHIVENNTLVVHTALGGKYVSEVNEDLKSFRKRIESILWKEIELKIADIKEKYLKQLRSIESKIVYEQEVLKRLEKELSAVKREKAVDTFISTVYFLAGKKRKKSSKRDFKKTIQQLERKIALSKAKLSKLETERRILDSELETRIKKLKKEYELKLSQIKEYRIKPKKKEIIVEKLCIVWIPVACNNENKPILNLYNGKYIM